MPQHMTIVIHGEMGIGKTWFAELLREELPKCLKPRQPLLVTVVTTTRPPHPDLRVEHGDQYTLEIE